MGLGGFAFEETRQSDIKIFGKLLLSPRFLTIGDAILSSYRMEKSKLLYRYNKHKPRPSKGLNPSSPLPCPTGGPSGNR